MLSFNQQGATEIGTSSDNAFDERWAAQSAYNDNTELLSLIDQIEECTQQTSSQTPIFHDSSNVAPQNYQYQSYQNAYTSHISSQMQINQIPVHHSPFFHPTLSQYLQPRKQNIPARSHQARICLVPNSSGGGFKAVVKRKRKRTMFTTEQVEALELVFQRKPYVTREDRQVLVQQLQLSDTSVKVWFQNRRLRGKRAAEEAAEQALYDDHIPSEESFYSDESTYQDSTEPSCSPTKRSRLDIIESELTQKADESGYITLDEKSLGDIASIIDSVLSNDISLDLEMPSSSSDDTNMPSNSSNEIEDLIDSDGSTCAGSVYEPISPAVSDCTEEECLTPRWTPFAPEQSLQRLFDLHFC